MREPIVSLERMKEMAEKGKVDVKVVCGREEDEESGVVVWVGKKREEVDEKEVEMLGRGEQVGRWRVESEVFGMRVDGA